MMSLPIHFCMLNLYRYIASFLSLPRKHVIGYDLKINKYKYININNIIIYLLVNWALCPYLTKSSLWLLVPCMNASYSTLKCATSPASCTEGNPFHGSTTRQLKKRWYKAGNNSFTWFAQLFIFYFFIILDPVFRPQEALGGFFQQGDAWT